MNIIKFVKGLFMDKVYKVIDNEDVVKIVRKSSPRCVVNDLIDQSRDRKYRLKITKENAESMAYALSQELEGTYETDYNDCDDGTDILVGRMKFKYRGSPIGWATLKNIATNKLHSVAYIIDDKEHGYYVDGWTGKIYDDNPTFLRIDLTI